jgi:hypothetical protein
LSPTGKESPEDDAEMLPLRGIPVGDSAERDLSVEKIR